jgi:hypothetical protein
MELNPYFTYEILFVHLFTCINSYVLFCIYLLYTYSFIPHELTSDLLARHL